MKIEFHQAFGTEYKTMAKGNIRFNELLDKSHGRVHGKIHLFGKFPFLANIVVNNPFLACISLFKVIRRNTRTMYNLSKVLVSL